MKNTFIHGDEEEEKKTNIISHIHDPHEVKWMCLSFRRCSVPLSSKLSKRNRNNITMADGHRDDSHTAHTPEQYVWQLFRVVVVVVGDSGEIVIFLTAFLLLLQQTAHSFLINFCRGNNTRNCFTFRASSSVHCRRRWFISMCTIHATRLTNIHSFE